MSLERRLTNSNFLAFAQMVAQPSQPDEYNAAAVKRLVNDYLDPYIVDVKGIRFKHHAKNRIELISFTTPEEQQAYLNAWEEYKRRLAVLEQRDVPGGRFMILVEFLKFRQAAELIRAPYLARRMWEIRNKKGRSAVGAVNFRETVAKITTILVNDYKVPRSRVSLIWGGMANKPNKKKTLTKEKIDELKELFSEEDLAFLREHGILDEQPNITDMLDNANTMAGVHKEKETSNLRLGTQTKNQRQAEIDRFQNDESDYCIFTFKSGGVGLSLHQELPSRRQREALIAPTYSAIELVQGLGRCARFTSCSDTEQTLIFYAGTIEYDVAMCTSQKLRCLKEVVRQRETWESVILNGQGRIEQEEPDVKQSGVTELSGVDEDADELVGGEIEEEDEENEN